MDAQQDLNETGSSLNRRLRAESARLGFDATGITSLRASDHATFFRTWLEAGYHGSMRWLARPDAVVRRIDPRASWPDLRSAIVVAHHYPPAPDLPASDPSKAIIARYALGRDYHRVMRPRLLALLRWLERETGRRLPAARACVDTSPVLERELAQRAGLGWFGRNTMLIHPRRGSWFFLGVLLVEIELEPDAPFRADHCGTCNACVDACPTGALLGRSPTGAPIMDARRCISYLTIEHRGTIPHPLRQAIGNRVFGCDICQEVCPFTRRFAVQSSEPDYQPGRRAALPVMRDRVPARRVPPRIHDSLPDGATTWLSGTGSPDLVDLLAMTRPQWDDFSRGRAIRRAGYACFLRNVAIALGNWGAPEALPPLAAALRHEESLVRAHAAWALGRIGGQAAARALAEHIDPDPDVRVERAMALDAIREREAGRHEAALSG